ncbi:MAG TPA: Rne/Rng family ribonuclease, partial [Acidobacteriota bacterium]|nr:Rne/Rng family ribonuclease [Acidobacteriota bacterium]
MSKELIVNSTSLETRLAILEDDLVTEIFIERHHDRSNLGNIYKGKVTRVLPGMQAAFVDIGLEKNAFLYVSDFFADYDDYEELFEETDQAIEEFLEKQADESFQPEPRHSKRTRKSSRQSREDSTKQEAPRSDKEQSAAPVGLLPVASLPIPHHRISIAPGGILPPTLTFTGALRRKEATVPEGILPSRLSPAPISPAPTIGADSAEVGDGEARFETETNIQELAASRNASRRSNGKRRASRTDTPLIGDLLKEGQEILVQIAKEPIGRKGARITSHIVLPGRYLVFMPSVDHVGVSRKIESARERQRLKQMILNLRGDIEKGFIVRTAGEGKSEEDFRQDMVYLTRLWERIRTKAEKASAPALIHAELNLVQRVIRDFFSDEYRAIRVDDEQQYEQIVEFISNFNPNLVNKVRLYTKKIPIFDAFNITQEIEKALKSKVWLKSGGYIVINQTEALVAIDVNTGKYVGQTNSLEDTITRTNLDAVKEVVRQIRLRDLGGIIVIDFIDMTDPRNRQKVMSALEKELDKDKSPSKILQFNEFGLVAITRKRVKQSLERTLCQPCLYCGGTGMTKSLRTVCYSIHNTVQEMLSTMGQGKELIIR